MKIPRSGLRGLALKEAAPDLLRTINLVRAAVEAKINGGAGPGAERKWFEVEAIYEDRVVVSLDGRAWSYPYTVAEGAVSLQDPQEVIETYVPLKEGAPLESELRLVEAEGEPAGVAWDAVLIRAGVSLNHVYYPAAVLREAAPRFEGVRVCIKSDGEHIKGADRDIRGVVGWIEAPRFVEGAGADSGHVEGRLRLPGLPEHTRSLLVAAVKAGRQDVAGLSIDARGRGSLQMREGKRVKAASSIDKVDSLDLIVEPGAGGRLIRLVESAPFQPGDSTMLREKILRFVEAKAPAVYAKLNPETVSDEDLEAAYREAMKADLAPAPARVAAGGNAIAEAEERIRMIEARSLARGAIDASALPQPAKDRLQRTFASRERFVEADVTAAIAEERDYLARFVESGRVQMDAFPGVEVENRRTKIGEMLDAFFDPAHKDHRSVQSFRECYVEMTGDRRVTGRLQDCDQSRMRESMGFREAAMTTSTYAEVLGDSITRRMVADYRTPSQYDVWREIASVTSVNDFRTQHRTRWGGFGDLPAVAQGADYVDAAIPSDEEATYGIGKTGRLAIVTMEMIRNDDVGLIRQLPIKISRAAKRTLSKFVLDFIRTNPVIYDTLALFHATHGNLGSAALSAASWSAAQLAVKKQTEADSGDRLGIPLRNLLVPSDLEEAAHDLFKQRGTNQDQSFIQTLAPKIIPVWYWTDATDWAATCDKMDIPFIEVGFLDGNEEPELFVQDSPTVGSLFSADKITYKVRHIYGGAVVDFRGGYKAVVVG
ncbi:MAG TPA: hypothetical protein PKD29_01770 [Rhodocyclaceae bacterium]|nr:hypothetical protein [Rhodocyclaceae bacterium]